MRTLTGGQVQVEAPGDTLGELITNLEAAYPGLEARLLNDGRLRGNIAVFIDDQQTTQGLRTRLTPTTRIYSAPAIAGG